MLQNTAFANNRVTLCKVRWRMIWFRNLAGSMTEVTLAENTELCLRLTFHVIVGWTNSPTQTLRRLWLYSHSVVEHWCRVIDKKQFCFQTLTEYSKYLFTVTISCPGTSSLGNLPGFDCEYLGKKSCFLISAQGNRTWASSVKHNLCTKDEQSRNDFLSFLM